MNTNRKNAIYVDFPRTSSFYPILSPENIKNLRFNHKYLKLSKMNKRRYYISMIRKKEFGIIHLVRT